MKVLVTGATGLLGKAVVPALLRRGHSVRAMVRPAASTAWLGEQAGDVEIVRADVRINSNLEEAFADVDALIHLAAAVTGDEDFQFANTVVGTERLLEAMARSQTKRLVLVSSFSVYGWDRIVRKLDEGSPLENDMYARDGYAVAKIWQERLARRVSRENNWQLLVLRPGFIWGPGNEFVYGTGHSFGPLHLVIGPRARPPITYVENCADAIVSALEHATPAPEQTFNIVDNQGVTNWDYFSQYLRRNRVAGRRLAIPYRVAFAAVNLVQFASNILFKGKGKLPSLLTARRFEARFKPLKCDNAKLRKELGWTPPFSFEEAVARTSSLAGGRQAKPVEGPTS